jgi:hypothetical protein
MPTRLAERAKRDGRGNGDSINGRRLANHGRLEKDLGEFGCRGFPRAAGARGRPSFWLCRRAERLRRGQFSEHADAERSHVETDR